MSLIFVLLAICLYLLFKSNLKKANDGDKTINIEKVRLQLLMASLFMIGGLIFYAFYSGILSEPWFSLLNE